MRGDPAATFGDSRRHYAASRPGAGERDGWRVRWALERAAPGVRGEVEQAAKQWNAAIREALRSEMALRLTTGGDAQAVPVKVVDGMPARFAEAMEELEGLEWLLLQRWTLASLAKGALFLESNVAEARGLWGDGAGPAAAEDARRVHETALTWLRKLDELQALSRIAGIEEDVLGAYYFRAPEIRLYWVVIGTIAQALGISAQSLTVVVLAHELAHAYTHLGYDIDGVNWDTDDFARASLDIVEGLAQFYAEAACERLAARAPEALAAYRTLLEHQRGPYRAHLEWGPREARAGETLRASMLVCRAQGITAAADFKALVERQRAGIRRARPAL